MLRLQLRWLCLFGLLALMVLFGVADKARAIIAGTTCGGATDISSGGAPFAFDAAASVSLTQFGTCVVEDLDFVHPADLLFPMRLYINTNNNGGPLLLNTFLIFYHSSVTDVQLDGVAYSNGTQINVLTEASFSRVLTYTFGGNNLTFTIIKAAGTDTLPGFAIAAASSNTAPSITSNGGNATAAINVAENQSAVTTVTATDPETDTVTFSFTGGADQALFDIVAATGVLTFKTAPTLRRKPTVTLTATMACRSPSPTVVRSPMCRILR